MKIMFKKYFSICLFLFCAFAFSSCYHQPPSTHDAAVKYSGKQLDSLSFYSNHHYTNNYNFVVKSDSIILIKQQPEEIVSGMPIDTLTIRKKNHLVVADIRFLKNDPVDSVWIEVARDQNTFGWIHESELIPNVVPDDPISQFISTFSDIHVLVSLGIFILIAATFLLRSLFRKKAYLIHFNDIDSFYPTLLAILVACSATFYASIQMYAPDTWRHFYYHPTLNPFSVPTILSIFLVSIWGILIMTLATIDDVRKILPFGEAVAYLIGLAGVCALNYILFSITTLYYVGYFILAIYVFFATWQYFKHNWKSYICGQCGKPIRKKGKCPYCGALND